MSDSNACAIASLRESVRFSAAVAAGFFVAALFCLYWAYSRGAFGNTTEEHLVNLKAGSSINVPLSVANRGDHNVEIRYSRNASDDVSKGLVEIFGKATLRSGGSVVAEVALPVDQTTSDPDGSAMILFTLPMNPQNHYELSLQVDRIPLELERSQAVVRTELDRLYPLIFLQVEVAIIVLLLMAMLSIFFSIRWWRAVHACEGNQ
jgi:hypothetical protein